MTPEKRQRIGAKRLIHGSMICLSKDNFKENILFATIADRDELIDEGMIRLEAPGLAGGGSSRISRG